MQVQSRLLGILCAVLLASTLFACGEEASPAPDERRLLVDPTHGLEVAEGVRLVPGDDGSLPVAVGWIKDAVAPDGLAIQGTTGYVFGGDSLDAFDIEDGTTIWSARPAGDHEGFESSGDVRIGTDGSGHVEVWAPYEMNLVVDHDTGHVLRRGPGHRDGVRGPDAAEPPRAFRMFTQARYDPVTQTVRLGDTEFVDQADRLIARRHDGTTLWTIQIDQPMFHNLGPVAVPGGMILVLANEKVLRLDYLGGGS